MLLAIVRGFAERGEIEAICKIKLVFVDFIIHVPISMDKQELMNLKLLFLKQDLVAIFPKIIVCVKIIYNPPYCYARH